MPSTFSRRAFVTGLGMLSVPLIALAQERQKKEGDDENREEKKNEAQEKAEEKKDEAKDKAEDAVDDRDNVVDTPRDRSQPGPAAGSTARCSQVTNRSGPRPPDVTS